MTQTQFLSRQETAEMLNVPVATVDRLIATGVLHRYRIRGRYVRVALRDVEQLLDVPREWLMRC